MEPVVENKDRPRATAISLLEAKVRAGEKEARRLLRTLERALVRCGYVRDGIYNSRQAGVTGRHERAVVLLWRDGKILLGRGLARHPDGNLVKRKDGGHEANPPASSTGMSAGDLVTVAHHLAPFVDALEGHSRHLAEALGRACETIQAMLDTVERSPLPSDEPAQMSEDADPRVG